MKKYTYQSSGCIESILSVVTRLYCIHNTFYNYFYALSVRVQMAIKNNHCHCQ